MFKKIVAEAAKKDIFVFDNYFVTSSNRSLNRFCCECGVE
jgi:hypothetical protein